jgi:hypothetical protein
MGTVTFVNRPNPALLAQVVDMCLDWMLEGEKCYVCLECFAPLKTAAEFKARFCALHLTSRKPYKSAAAFAPRARSQRGHSKRSRGKQA